MTKARPKPQQRPTPRGEPRTQRELFRRAARQLGVSASDYERADILAQIAELLMRQPAIGEVLAFKGGAIMTLIDGSPRLSADLDAVVVSGRAVRDRHVRAALGAELDGRRIVTDVGIMNPGRQSLQYPFVQARSFSGLGDVNIRLELSWREAPLMPAELVGVRIPRDVQLGAGRSRLIQLPVLARVERIAEKVRAFLERGLDRDAFDLYHHARGLSTAERTLLRRLVQRKLETGELPETAICTCSSGRRSKAHGRDGRAASSSWPTRLNGRRSSVSSTRRTGRSCGVRSDDGERDVGRASVLDHLAWQGPL